MRIALVNDMMAAIEAIRRVVLSTREHQVAWIAHDGSEALALCAHDTPDLILMDLIMPGMDGVKLGAQLLRLQPDLLIIITTGYSGVLTAGKVRELGFQEILSKPSTARTLGETVHRVLQRTASTKT